MTKEHTATVGTIGRFMTGAQKDAVLRICAKLKSSAGALMPILHAVQNELGFVPHDSVPVIARPLSTALPRTSVTTSTTMSWQRLNCWRPNCWLTMTAISRLRWLMAL